MFNSIREVFLLCLDRTSISNILVEREPIVLNHTFLRSSNGFLNFSSNDLMVTSVFAMLKSRYDPVVIIP